MLHGCFRRCRHVARYRIGPGFLLACKSASFTIIGEFASGRPEIFELCPTVFYSLLLPFAFLCRPTSYIQRYMYHFCSLGLWELFVCALLPCLFFILCLLLVPCGSPSAMRCLFVVEIVFIYGMLASRTRCVAILSRSPFCHCDR